MDRVPAKRAQQVSAGLDALERVVDRLEATIEIARAVGGETRLDRVLALIAERGRTVIGARALLIMLREDAGLRVAAAAGHVYRARPGALVPLIEGPLAEALTAQRAVRLAGEDARLALPPDVRSGRAAALAVVPLAFRGETLGVLAAVDRDHGSAPFDDDAAALLEALAASAATAVTTARSVERERDRVRMQAAESERRRVALELHDQTLQGLAAVRRSLALALRDDVAADPRDAAREAIARLGDEIEALRGIVRRLRPIALEDRGLVPALAALIEHHERDDGGPPTSLAVQLRDAPGGRLSRDVEETVYRIVQEALTNVARHSGASRASVAISATPDTAVVLVADDGHGFDLDAAPGGLGLTGMRERAAGLGGALEITGGPAGTTVTARLPLG